MSNSWPDQYLLPHPPCAEIVEVPYPRDQYDEHARADFVELAAMLSRASAFSLRKPLVPHIGDIFNLQSGVFVIHCAVTHKEDYDWEFAETVPHYIVYNAGTRVLFLAPPMAVAEMGATASAAILVDIAAAAVLEVAAAI